MSIGGRMRRLEGKAAAWRAERWALRQATIRAMTPTMRALRVLDLFERTRHRAGRPIPPSLVALRAALAMPGSEAAETASKVLARARELRAAWEGD